LAITLTNIKTRFKTRVRADLAAASLAVSDIHDDSITQWANEETATVIHALKEPYLHFLELIVPDGAITFSSGSSAYPSANHQRTISVKVTSSYLDKDGDTITLTDRRARLTYDNDEFNRFDSSNFLTTPTGKRPMVLVANKLYVKPTTITAGKITYIDSHPLITGDQDTVFDDVGDNLLILLIIRRYYQFIEEEGLVNSVNKEIGAFVGNINK